MKKRSLGVILAAAVLAVAAPGAALAAKKDSCPAGTWVLTTGANLLTLDRVGDRPLDPDAYYCAKISPGQYEVWVVGPELTADDL